MRDDGDVRVRNDNCSESNYAEEFKVKERVQFSFTPACSSCTAIILPSVSLIHNIYHVE